MTKTVNGIYEKKSGETWKFASEFEVEWSMKGLSMLCNCWNDGSMIPIINHERAFPRDTSKESREMIKKLCWKVPIPGKEVIAGYIDLNDLSSYKHWNKHFYGEKPMERLTTHMKQIIRKIRKANGKLRLIFVIT